MGKQYLRYEQLISFGNIFSSGNVTSDITSKHAICPSLENINIWHIRTGELFAQLSDSDNKSRVTCLLRIENKVAAGYEDGSIRIWDLESKECQVKFNGHKSAISCLAYENNILFTGSKDTDIIAWDLLTETGLYKLRGHKDQVTSIVFYENYLISSSKDTYIKVWDLVGRCCIETVVGHRSEVWSLALLGDLLVSGSSEDELKLWNVNKTLLDNKLKSEVIEGEMKENLGVKICGHLQRSSKERISSLSIDKESRFLAVHSADRNVEFFRIRNEEEMKKVLKKRGKKQNDAELTSADKFVSKRIFKAKSKIQSFEFLGSGHFLVGLANNSIGYFKFSLNKENKDIEESSMIDQHGHRSEIRTVAVSYDDSMILTACDTAIKLWNTVTGNCIRTLPSGGGSPTDCMFLPGNKHVIVSTREGTLDLYDCQAAILLESISAHSAAIWSIQMRPDKGGIMSGSSDKTVKFWDFGLVDDKDYSRTARRLTLFHMRTLELSEEVKCVRYSPDQKIIAVALLDSTIKVFYHDTLKFFLSLYGHKLPVTSIDISSDNQVLVSGSADKNVKLWGLDFGDCHRSIFAHEDVITGVKFVPNTHYFFSCSKDKSLKYFDGDNFQQIMLVGKHQGDIKSMALGKWGNLIVTVGQDKSLKVWRKTDEPLFLEEEREKEVEEQINAELQQNDDGNEESLGKQSIENLKAGERVLEALIIAEEHWAQWKVFYDNEGKYPKPDLHPMLKAHDLPDPELYVLKVFQKIKPSEIDGSLWTLPFSKIPTMISVLAFWVERNLSPSLTVQIISFITSTFINQMSATSLKTHDGLFLATVLLNIRDKFHSNVKKLKDRAGFNVAGIKFIKNIWEQEHINEMADIDEEFNKKFEAVKLKSKKNKKRSIASVTIRFNR